MSWHDFKAIVRNNLWRIPKFYSKYDLPTEQLLKIPENILLNFMLQHVLKQKVLLCFGQN